MPTLSVIRVQFKRSNLAHQAQRILAEPSSSSDTNGLRKIQDTLEELGTSSTRASIDSTYLTATKNEVSFYPNLNGKPHLLIRDYFPQDRLNFPLVIITASDKSPLPIIANKNISLSLHWSIFCVESPEFLDLNTLYLDTNTENQLILRSDQDGTFSQVLPRQTLGEYIFHALATHCAFKTTALALFTPKKINLPENTLPPCWTSKKYSPLRQLLIDHEGLFIDEKAYNDLVIAAILAGLSGAVGVDNPTGLAPSNPQMLTETIHDGDDLNLAQQLAFHIRSPGNFNTLSNLTKGYREQPFLYLLYGLNNPLNTVLTQKKMAALTPELSILLTHECLKAGKRLPPCFAIDGTDEGPYFLAQAEEQDQRQPGEGSSASAAGSSQESDRSPSAFFDLFSAEKPKKKLKIVLEGSHFMSHTQASLAYLNYLCETSAPVPKASLASIFDYLIENAQALADPKKLSALTIALKFLLQHGSEINLTDFLTVANKPDLIANVLGQLPKAKAGHQRILEEHTLVPRFLQTMKRDSPLDIDKLSQAINKNDREAARTVLQECLSLRQEDPLQSLATQLLDRLNAGNEETWAQLKTGLLPQQKLPKASHFALAFSFAAEGAEDKPPASPQRPEAQADKKPLAPSLN